MYPNHKDKWKLKPLFTASEYLDYARGQGAFLEELPENMILCFHQGLINHIRASKKIREIKGSAYGAFAFEHEGREIGLVGNFGIGASMTTAAIEELIAAGMKKVICVGLTGTLQKNINIGDLIVCDRAIRDEGTSHHYLPPGKYVAASSTLTEALSKALKSSNQPFHKGTIWTTDAVFRETIEEIKTYQDEGVLGVEMETSAIFAVAKIRSIEAASILVVSDSLANLKWDPQFHNTEDAVNKAGDLAISVL